jgi:hypothetical protein
MTRTLIDFPHKDIPQVIGEVLQFLISVTSGRHSAYMYFDFTFISSKQ